VEFPDVELAVNFGRRIKVIFSRSISFIALGTTRILEDLHIAVLLVHELTLYDALTAVAFGEKSPSHMSIICREYHCLIPSSAASLSTKSFSIAARSFWIVDVTFCRMLVNQEPIDVGFELGEDEVLVALIRL
jgi:hypothetical protein